MTITMNCEAIHGHKKGGNCHPVYHITTGTVYSSVGDAAKANGIHPNNLSRILHRTDWKINSKWRGQFCWLSEVTEHLGKIQQNIHESQERCKQEVTEIKNLNLELIKENQKLDAENQQLSEAMDDIVRKNQELKEANLKLHNQYHELKDALAVIAKTINN